MALKKFQVLLVYYPKFRKKFINLSFSYLFCLFILLRNKEGGIKMDLIIGGAFQGKKDYAITNYNLKEKDIFHGETDCLPEGENKDWSHIKAISEFHLLILRWMKSELSVEKMVETIWQENPNIIIITNEIGNGIVPIDCMERRWREKTGRICCDLAKKANQVIRVYCGIGMKIK